MHLRIIVTPLVFATCGIFVPLSLMHAHRARVTEAVVAHAVLLTHQLGDRAVKAGARGRLSTFDFTPWRTEPGVEAAWITDRSGTVVAAIGSVGRDVRSIAPMSSTASHFFARATDNGAVWLRESITSASAIVGAVGLRFSPAQAVAALGLSSAAPCYLLVMAGLGTVVILFIFQREERPTVPTPHAPLPTRHDLAFLQPLADSFLQPVLIFDAAQRLVIANAAAVADGVLSTVRAGLHLLDLSEVVAWGPLAAALLDQLAHGTRRTAHAHDALRMGPSLSAVRLEIDAAMVGFWLTVESAERMAYDHHS